MILSYPVGAAVFFNFVANVHIFSHVVALFLINFKHYAESGAQGQL